MIFPLKFYVLRYRRILGKDKEYALCFFFLFFYVCSRSSEFAERQLTYQFLQKKTPKSSLSQGGRSHFREHLIHILWINVIVCMQWIRKHQCQASVAVITDIQRLDVDIFPPMACRLPVQPSIIYQCLLSTDLLEVGVHPSSHWERGVVHPGQIAS